MKRGGGLGEVVTVFLKEVRCLLRDRQTVVYSLLVPIFLYPAVILGLLQGFSYVQGVQERRTVRVGFTGEEAVRALETPETLQQIQRLRKRLESTKGVGVVPFEAKSGFYGVRLETRRLKTGRTETDQAETGETLELDVREAARRVIVGGRLDAVLEATLEEDQSGEISRLSAEIYYSEALDGSREACRRISRTLKEYREELLLDLVSEQQLEKDFLEVVTTEEEDLSTGEELTNYIAGLTLPILMVVMLSLGALYPALDTCVGEKERRSLETTLVLPVSRSSIVLGKYLAVTCFSLFAFVLNFASMGLTLSHLGMQTERSTLQLGLWSIVVIAIAAVLLAVFLSGIVMLLAFLAQSYKEGQSYVAPVYMVALVTALVTSSPEAVLNLGSAWIPVVNLVLLVRGALNADFPALPMFVTVASSILYAGVALWAGARILGRESVLTGGRVRLRRLLSLLAGSEQAAGPETGEGGPS